MTIKFEPNMRSALVNNGWVVTSDARAHRDYRYGIRGSINLGADHCGIIISRNGRVVLSASEPTPLLAAMETNNRAWDMEKSARDLAAEA